MYTGVLNIIFKNIEMLLLPERAVYLPQSRQILISDLHIGKSRYFREEGIAVPEQLSFAELQKISDILSKLEIESIVILGDLFHNSYNPDWNEFCKWRNKYHQIKIELVKGNHDLLNEDLYKDADIILCNNKLILDRILLFHDLSKISDKKNYIIAGHVHPAVRLIGYGKQQVTLPCFYFGKDHALLPAFGRFTGNHVITPDEKDDIYVIVNGQVIKI